jgi:hypothetical protein
MMVDIELQVVLLTSDVSIRSLDSGNDSIHYSRAISTLWKASILLEDASVTSPADDDGRIRDAFSSSVADTALHHLDRAPKHTPGFYLRI